MRRSPEIFFVLACFAFVRPLRAQAPGDDAPPSPVHVVEPAASPALPPSANVTAAPAPPAAEVTEAPASALPVAKHARKRKKVQGASSAKKAAKSVPVVTPDPGAKKSDAPTAPAFPAVPLTPVQPENP
jgi:hypothetical protein